MRPDLFVHAIVNDLFDEDLDEDFFAELEAEEAQAAPADEAEDSPAPARPRRLC